MNANGERHTTPLEAALTALTQSTEYPPDAGEAAYDVAVAHVYATIGVAMEVAAVADGVRHLAAALAATVDAMARDDGP